MVQLSPFIHAFSALAQAASQQSSSGELAIRQSAPIVPISALPAQCQTGCQILQTIVNCGSNPSQSCVCTSSAGPQLVSCLNCLEAAQPNNPNLGSAEQALINDFNQLCGTHLTLSNPSGNPPSSGSGSTGSQAGSSSGPSPKLGGAVSLKTAGMGICVAAAAIGAYLAL